MRTETHANTLSQVTCMCVQNSTPASKPINAHDTEGREERVQHSKRQRHKNPVEQRARVRRHVAEGEVAL